MGEAEEQIKSTYERLQVLLREECKHCNDYLKQITWKAYIHRATGGPSRQAEECVEKLESFGFSKGNAVVLSQSDITNFLRADKKEFKKKKNR